jgi:hypothetical protein
MENTRQIHPDFGTLPWSACLLDKVHSCADCPIRRLAVKRPRSIFARIHAWHMTWWPGWKVQLARARSLGARAKA